jgi:hypothetical protein
MTFKPIDIDAKPELVNPPDRIGRALDIPLTATPSGDWMQAFIGSLDNDGLGVPRIEFADQHLRLWLTSRASSRVGELLTAVTESISSANSEIERMTKRREAANEEHRSRSQAEQRRVDDAIAQWWAAERQAH